MTDETNGSENRVELVQRIELMEQMIAEGRQATARSGWIFILWGLVYTVAMAWQMFFPVLANWAWPVCVAVGLVILWTGKARLRRSGRQESVRSRSIAAVWRAMGMSIGVFVMGIVWSHPHPHIWPPAYTAMIMILVGLAHMTSALILRWGAQAVAGAVWWIGAIAAFSANVTQAEYLFLAATFLGMILFGVYAMLTERHKDSAMVDHHA